MFPTFVIGLREGLEAALIVGIVAAFLRKEGKPEVMRYLWVGVAAAVTLCLAVGVGLRIAENELPELQQERLETVISLVAVCMVTYMIFWMRKHARGLKGDLESHAATALAAGSMGALVLMAFLAVLREGFETAVFLLAAFNASSNAGAAGLGAVLGIAVSIVLGWAIYAGGLRINLSRFFSITGFILVIVAAGLFATAVHTGHEAGWISFGQTQVWDLHWLVRRGSVQAALLTGMLGIQARPVSIEVIAWLAYFIPMTLVVFWPASPKSKPQVDLTTSATEPSVESKETSPNSMESVNAHA